MPRAVGGVFATHAGAMTSITAIIVHGISLRENGGARRQDTWALIRPSVASKMNMQSKSTAREATIHYTAGGCKAVTGGMPASTITSMTDSADPAVS